MSGNNTDPLENWQDWQVPFSAKPELLAELGGGRTNQACLVKADEQLWVLRLNAANSEALGINRERECRILAEVSAAGIAPEVLYCSPEQGVLVTAYIEGRHWRASDLVEPGKLGLLQAMLARLHAIELPEQRFNYREHAENYWQALLARKSPVDASLQQQREHILSFIDDLPRSASLCHHDLVPGNLVESAGRLYVLDWEYAGAGWPALDYATLAIEWNTDADSLLKNSTIDRDELLRAQSLYAYLCELWEALQAEGSQGVS